MSKKIKLAPSLLDIDYGNLNAEIQRLEPIADLFHVDIMDGNFVPNLSVGLPVVRAMKTKVPLDCHLMILHPENYIQRFAEAGAYSITIHVEASTDLKRDIRMIRDAGCKAAVAINPDTPVDVLKPILSTLDMVLVMSVHPGFGGQTFIPAVLEKISWIHEHYPALDIQVDGGINEKTAPLAIQAGATILVAGSYLVKASDPVQAALRLNYN